MVVYNCGLVEEITNEGISFKNGTRIMFSECRKNWAKEHNINLEDTYCVAERNILSNPPYFIFYSEDRIKVIFNKTFLIWKTKDIKRFEEMKKIIKQSGYTSYDLS